MQDDVRANVVTLKTIEVSGKVFSDQTGRFPITVSRGKQYIMVMYYHDTNTILAEAMKNRLPQEIVRAQAHLHNSLSSRGFTSRIQVLDNKCPEI